MKDKFYLIGGSIVVEDEVGSSISIIYHTTCRDAHTSPANEYRHPHRIASGDDPRKKDIAH